MPNLTTNYSFNLPLVNNATDADLWGGQLNSNWTSLDGILPTPVASKFGAVVVQSTDDLSFEIVSTQGSSGDVLLSAGADALPVWTTKTASDTTAGFVELATNAELQTGTDTSRAVTPANILAALGFTKTFTSSQQTYTLGGTLTIAHSLGRTPFNWDVFMICTSTDLGYSVNDVIKCSGADTNSGNAVSVVCDATNMVVRFTNTAPVITNKTTGALNNNDTSKWKYIFKAWG